MTKSTTNSHNHKVARPTIKDPVRERYAKQLPAGQATMAQIGPAFAPKGIKSMDLVKSFNDHPQSKAFPGQQLTAVVHIDPAKKTFTLDVRKPPVTVLLKQALGVKTLCKTPGRSSIGTLTSRQIYDIAVLKQSDLPNTTIQGAYNTVLGAAKSSGITVTGAFPG
jgi:large subunit ribosomal protein L11